MPGRRRPRGADVGELPPPDADTAMEIAAHFLGARPRTRWELERRLRRAATSDDVISITLEKLTAMGYIDDAAFTRWWAEQRDRHAPRGRRMVEAELRKHGVPREVLESLRGSELFEPRFDAESLPTTETERARVALQRHLKGRPLPVDYAARQRTGAFLLRRGFDPEMVRATLRAAGSDDPEDS